MQPLRHSYTNRTLGDGATVVKCYQGPDAPARSQREHAMPHALRGQIPVPPVLSAEDACLTMTFMTGIHGQELLEAGHGGGVLRACGTMHHPRQVSLLNGHTASPRPGHGRNDRRHVPGTCRAGATVGGETEPHSVLSRGGCRGA
jgi:hypothetical protein